MDDLLLAGGGHAVDVHRPALDNIKSPRRLALAKKIFVFRQRFDGRGHRNFLQIARRQARKQPAAAQRVDDDGAFEFGERCSHAAFQTTPPQK